MNPPPVLGRWPPYLVLAAFVVLLLSPTVIAAAALVTAAIGTAIVRGVRARAARSGPVPAAGTAALLGTADGGRPVHLTDHQLSAHALVLGASGAGKTTTLLTILTDQVRRGRSVVAIDMKGSPAFARELATAAEIAGRPFRLWSLDGPEHWNPLAQGNPTELKDRLISAERWTEPHYQRAAERYVQTVLQVWEHARPDRRPTLRDVVDLMDHRRLVAMLRHVPRPLAQRVQDYMVTLGADQLSAVRGLETRLAIIADSHTGAYLEPPAPGAGAPGPSGMIDLQAAMRDRDVVLFSLNSSRYGKLAAQVGALVVQDLTSAMGSRLEQGGGGPAARGSATPAEPAVVGVDELSALGAEHVLNLYARGREAHIPVLAATQELADLERAARGLRDQLIGITGVKIAHRQDVPASALTIAQIAGTERVWEHTFHTDRRALLPGRDTGRGTRRQVERYRVEPDTIKTLPTGHAVVITKIPTASVQKVRVVRPGWRKDQLERG
jgi:conjugal transfer pilus assembly protein TraD